MKQLSIASSGKIALLALLGLHSLSCTKIQGEDFPGTNSARSQKERLPVLIIISWFGQLMTVQRYCVTR
ncbi:hypothetical protein LWM68_18100 [Niabella sp. W65]|nr:hypothetical protein [Niabella sp. W65]MCH7364491.1 hypothetical protein [Niabella sp. W65]ULT40353.1 hypothetical protein KRR40_36990 [Niabella sp. I65]